jgi:hypothetical protein
MATSTLTLVRSVFDFPKHLGTWRSVRNTKDQQIDSSIMASSDSTALNRPVTFLSLVASCDR